MLNKIADGKTVKYLNVGSEVIPSGTPIAIFGKCGVAVNPIEAGKVGVLNLEGGAIEVPIASAPETAMGAPVYIADGEVVLTSASGAEQIGYTYEAVEAGATIIKVYCK